MNQFFSPVTITDRHGDFEMDCEQIRNWDWGEPVPWSEVTGMWIDASRLEIQTVSGGQLTVNLKHYRKQVPRLIELLQSYHSRYQAAAAFQSTSGAESSSAR